MNPLHMIHILGPIGQQTTKGEKALFYGRGSVLWLLSVHIGTKQGVDGFCEAKQWLEFRQS